MLFLQNNQADFGRFKFYPTKRSNSNHDKDLLLREAGAINATVTWISGRHNLHIIVEAPKGFIWASTRERLLEASSEVVDGTWIRETVQNLLADMQELYNLDGAFTHEDTCECDECESATDDPELSDLPF